jgi:hypothetical protein
MARQVNYLNPAGLRIVLGRINPLIRVQLETGFSQNFELNRFLQPMPLKVSNFEKVSIGESAPRMQDPDGIAPEQARRTDQ